jgi:predicted metalloprotease with PDZ domain
MAARYSREAAKDWRPLGDSTRDAIINPRERTEWHSLQRAEDYYDEGALLWLDADTLIRETSRGKRSLEDFARQFFASGQEAPSPKPYDLAELIQALRLVAPIDWAGFFAARIDQTGHWDPAAGLRRGGYDLVFNNEPGPSCTADDARRGLACFTASIGLTLAADGTVDSVEWDGPAFRAGIAPATKLVAVDGRGFTLGRLTAAILGAQGSAEPIELLVQDQDRLDRVVLPWHGGLQIPHLVRSARGPASLDAILRPLPAQK